MTSSFACSPVHFTHTARRDDLLVGAVLAASALLAECGTHDSTTCKIANVVTPYRINIVQGSFVSREQATQLKKGMTRDQVRFILGTPLLTDMSHINRQDHIFSFRRGNTLVVQKRRLMIWLDGDRLTKWVGVGELPSRSELISEIDGIKRPEKDAAQAIAATGVASAARVSSVPLTEVIGRTQLTTNSKNSVDVMLSERRTGGGGADTSVPPLATTSP